MFSRAIFYDEDEEGLLRLFQTRDTKRESLVHLIMPFWMGQKLQFCPIDIAPMQAKQSIRPFCSIQ